MTTLGLHVNQGEDHYMAKLDDRKIRAIRFYHNKGKTIQFLADTYKVNYQTIWDVVNYRTWIHIHGDD
jgi:hypothetical protein